MSTLESSNSADPHFLVTLRKGASPNNWEQTAPSNLGAQSASSLSSTDPSTALSTPGAQSTPSLPTTGSGTDCSCSPCPGNWVQFSMSCYQYSAEKEPWKESQQACKSQNSTLLHIDGLRELNFFKFFQLSGWIGLSRTGPDSSLKWEDETTYTRNLDKLKSALHKSLSFTKERKGGDCALYLNEKSISMEDCAIGKLHICERQVV
ncbi:NKG2-D type II integral membrane protein-like isoform X2 [Ornithorhynchus anatinus]|nr:NKG2-D type II integral membrane protein-like isoform X2 [Ornithorhynchus anatinus]